MLQIQSTSSRHSLFPPIHNDAATARETQQRVVQDLSRINGRGSGGSWFGHFHRFPVGRVLRIDRGFACDVHRSRCVEHTDHVVGVRGCQQVFLKRARTSGKHPLRGQNTFALRTNETCTPIPWQNNGYSARIIRPCCRLKRSIESNRYKRKILENLLLL